MTMTPKEAYQALDKYLLRDGMNMILDFEKSQGNYLYDSLNDKKYLDFFSFFASLPLGFNHPKMKGEAYLAKLTQASEIKPSNSDVYTIEMAEFVDTFGRIVGDEDFKHFFFVSGGALAVENALKAAFDWKIKKNMAAGKGEKGQQIIHFKEAFHGRSGYTMSLTNTDPQKVAYFPKFDWPRITTPKCLFPMNEENTAKVIASEKQALAEIHQALADNPDDIAAILIEPIQSEGGDNHFRPEFLNELRKICDQEEVILIFDEVQTGLGLTGKMWCFEHFPDAKPDIVCFGKKAQVCGIMATDRLNQVDSVFKVSSRINSTFGGNLVDMVRCQRYLEVIVEDNLVENAAKVGAFIKAKIEGLCEQFDSIDNPRGQGLLVAFDCPSAEFRSTLIDTLLDQGMIILSCGTRSVRLRPGLTMSEEDAQIGLDLLEKALKEMNA